MRTISSSAAAILVAFAAMAEGARADILESPNACAIPADITGPGANWQPGGDAYGRPVTPADMAAPSLAGELRVPAERPSETVNGILLKFLLGEFRIDLETGAVAATGNLAGITEPPPADCPPMRR